MEPVINEVGDLVLHEPQMRALAHPVRLALFDHLSRHGPATIAALAADVGQDGQEVEAGVAELAAAGLIVAEPDKSPEDGTTRWRAIARGIFFEVPSDSSGQAAARDLTRVMFLAYESLPRQWVADHEPQLDPSWWQAAGLFNAGMTVTSDELSKIQVELEELLKPYLNRSPNDAPAGSRRVRLLSYFMPQSE